MGNKVHILGIDPGQSGGIALLRDGLEAQAWKMPETERDLYDLLAEIKTLGGDGAVAVLEKVWAMPKQGVASTWKFGQHYGLLRGFLIALKIPFETVPPGVWQRRMGCLSHGNKNITKAKAQELFPTLRITHALADALLIAEDKRRLMMTKPGLDKARTDEARTVIGQQQAKEVANG